MDKKIFVFWESASKRQCEAMINSNFYLKNYIRKDGRQQVILQLTSSGKRKRIPLNVFATENEWDKKRQRMKASAQNSADFNLILDKTAAKITDIQINYRLSDSSLTLERLVNELKNETPQLNFISFCNFYSKEQQLAPGTRRKEKSHIKKLEDFKENLMFSQLTVEFMDRYRAHLVKVGNSRNTINTNMKTICKYINLAKKYGIKINLSSADIETKNFRSNRTFLDETEIGKLIEYYSSGFISKKHKLVLGYFLFSCNTGLRISELNLITRNKVLNQKILIYYAPKTGKETGIQLNSKVQSILKNNSKLFVKFISKQKMNAYLKDIMQITGIRKTITFHCARHSFATNFLRKGGKVEDLQVLLGHSDIKTTMIYVHARKGEEIDAVHNL